MAKIGNLPHHLNARTPPQTPDLIAVAHTPPPMPQRSSVTDSDATKVDSSARQKTPVAPQGETTMDKLGDTAQDFIDDFK